MLLCKTYQVLTTPKPLPEPITVGRTMIVLCEGRDCPNRTAPVFLVLGARGAFTLCTACRTRHHRIVRESLPDLRRKVRA